jgi:hypothetical protein
MRQFTAQMDTLTVESPYFLDWSIWGLHFHLLGVEVGVGAAE